MQIVKKNKNKPKTNYAAYLSSLCPPVSVLFAGRELRDTVQSIR